MDIKIRKATEKDIKGIVKVHVDSWKTTYKGILPDKIIDNITYESREKQWKSIFKQAVGNQYRYVAETLDKKIIGFIDGGPERTGKYDCDGELYAIYLLEEYQGYKVGKRLFQTLMSEFIKNDIDSVLVWVISNNPSICFYEKFSPERVDTKFLERVNVQETAYCWRDINYLHRVISD
ncbi:GNAT family N-acetyltransferase [Bacillus cereus]|uniref:GNAT family N-acetyltransferase n=1 Tax=Bacillus sp. AFS023182 TaxID=2033492 RepID=UPI000BF8B2D6|nr:GNAT family N-acetyltransferase [Bacillus sp. AFS023182]PFE02948.1 GNAT family N-acetyltransferase [Bacillus sp. AFS023182]PGX92666.1 GNAT family N-acetyltransferase [Bacillus cereus]